MRFPLILRLPLCSSVRFGRLFSWVFPSARLRLWSPPAAFIRRPCRTRCGCCLGFWLLFAFRDSLPSMLHFLTPLGTSLSKCLAHQASLTASMTAFLWLKRRQFYLSHLPAYFSEANKRSIGLCGLSFCGVQYCTAVS